ncbi:MAG: NADH-quinone oxidoreductase subunit J family protein, partial [Planctomycetota bacterium]
MIGISLLIPATEAAAEAQNMPDFGWTDFFFYFFGLIAIVAAFEVITQDSPINSAVFLVITFLAVAGEYALLSAHFLAVIQVLVYAGAIMVLFLFVVMLLDLRPEELVEKRHIGLWAIGFVLFFLLVIGGFMVLRP